MGFIRKKKICTDCKKLSYIKGHGRCAGCYQRNYAKQYYEKQSEILSKDKEFYIKTWQSSTKKCAETGKALRYSDATESEIRTNKEIFKYIRSTIHHIRSKRRYKHLRYEPSNCIVISPEIHHIIEYGTDTQKQSLKIWNQINPE